MKIINEKDAVTHVDEIPCDYLIKKKQLLSILCLLQITI